MKDVKVNAKVSPAKAGRQESAGAGKSAGVATDYDLGVIYGGFDHIYYRMAEVVNTADVIKRGLATLTSAQRKAIPGDHLFVVERAIEKIYEFAKNARNVAYEIQVAIHRKRMGAK